MNSIALRISFYFFALVCVFLFTLHNSAYAYTLGSPHWVERPTTNGGLLFGGDCRPDINGNMVCDPPYCVPFTLGPYSTFGQGSWDYVFYTDSTCSRSSDIPWATWAKVKEAVCPAGEIMTGTRFYAWSDEVDDEHHDAKCATISGVTLGASRWVTPVNAFNELNPGYKIATCGTDEVMTGIRMYGMTNEVDDEHVIARCTKITGVSAGGTYYWKEAPNAYSELYGGYKDASCNSGDILRGARWYEWSNEVDEEHTDAYCYAPPSVNVWFSTLMKAIRSFM